MSCKHCGRDVGYPGYHLCSEAIRKHRESMTPEQQDAQRKRMKQLLDQAIEAGKELKKHGIELVC